jgi:N-acetylmuramoyl-L-alanine amidase
VLLETGYLSNEDDSKFLFSPAGQMRIARGVRRAVEGHFLRRIAQR